MASGHQLPGAQSPFQTNLIGGATITVDTQASTLRNVSVQLKTPDGFALAEAGVVTCYLATAATGAVVSTAPSGTVAIATKGTIVVALTAKLVLLIKSATDGIFDLAINSSAGTYYLIVVLPDGSIVASAALTWA